MLYIVFFFFIFFSFLSSSLFLSRSGELVDKSSKMMNPNMIPMSLARQQANNQAGRTSDNSHVQFRSWFRRDVSAPRNPGESLSEEHPALREKNHRLGFRIFKFHVQSSELRPSLGNTEPTIPPPSHRRTRNDSHHVPTSEQGHSSVSERRDEVTVDRRRQAWVRRPRRKYGSFDTRKISYRQIIKNRNVRLSMITCGVSGLLLLAVLGICKDDPFFRSYSLIYKNTDLILSW